MVSRLSYGKQRLWSTEPTSGRIKMTLSEIKGHHEVVRLQGVEGLRGVGL
jgi:hypothetical protein